MVCNYIQQMLWSWFVVGVVFVSVAESSYKEEIPYSAINCRKHSASLTDFGGKGDGITSNTAAFKAAIANLSKLASDGGALLVVPPGKWLTGSFNLASHFTLYIHHKAVLVASQVSIYLYFCKINKLYYILYICG